MKKFFITSATILCCWVISFQAMDESDLNYLEPA